MARSISDGPAGTSNCGVPGTDGIGRVAQPASAAIAAQTAEKERGTGNQRAPLRL